MKRKRNPLIFCLLAPLLALVLVGCNNWEQQTYQTLAASKAVIDTAGQQYNAGQLPQTPPVFKVITDARTAQTTAVDAFKEYLYLKASGATTTDLQAQQQAVTNAVANVGKLIADIKTLKGGS